jgi:hypothetical protein
LVKRTLPMPTVRAALAVLLLVWASVLSALLGCSSGRPVEGDGIGSNSPGGPGQLGAIGMNLTLPGGEHVSKFSYTLANARNTYTGSYGVSGAGTLSYVIGSVAAGAGYALNLTATSDDGMFICAYPSVGSPSLANITVVNRTTTVVNVNLQCVSVQGLDASNVLVNAVTSNCPVWNAIVANPVNITVPNGTNVDNGVSPGSTAFLDGGTNVAANVYAGQQAVIIGSATAPNPGALAFVWSVSAGALSSASGQVDPNSTDAGVTNQTIYTCPAVPGLYTVSLALFDGPLPDGGSCNSAYTTGSVTVNCLAPPPSCPVGTGCGDGGQVCNVAGNCVPALFSVVMLNSLDGGVIDNLGQALPISIQTFSPTGPVGSPLVLPTGSDSRPPITLKSNNVTDGDLVMSTDGRYLTMLGWNATPGASLLSASPVVARIDSTGSVDTTTVMPSAFHDGTMATAVCSVASVDGTGFWMSGVNTSSELDGGAFAGGIYYAPLGATTATQLVSFPSMNPLLDNSTTPSVNSNWVRIFGGQLYASTEATLDNTGSVAVPYMISIGANPLPKTGTPAVSILPGFDTVAAPPLPSPYGFVMFDLFPPAGPDTLYIADDGMNPPSSNGSSDQGTGGITKWTFNGSTWSQVMNGTTPWKITDGNFPTALDSGVSAFLRGKPIGFRGLAGYATGSNVTLMATTGNINGNPDSVVVMLQDTAASTTAPSVTPLATTPPSQVFRGVALTPQ